MSTNIENHDNKLPLNDSLSNDNSSGAYIQNYNPNQYHLQQQHQHQHQFQHQHQHQHQNQHQHQHQHQQTIYPPQSGYQIYTDQYNQNFYNPQVPPGYIPMYPNGVVPVGPYIQFQQIPYNAPPYFLNTENYQVDSQPPLILPPQQPHFQPPPPNMPPSQFENNNTPRISTKKKFSASAPAFIPSKNHSEYISKVPAKTLPVQPKPLSEGTQESSPIESDSIKFITPSINDSNLDLINSNTLTTINSDSQIADYEPSSEKNDDDDKLIFQVPYSNTVSLPLIIGTTLSKFNTLKSQHFKDDEKNNEIDQHQKSDIKVDAEKRQEKLDIEDKEVLPQPEQIKPLPATPKINDWASIALKGAQKPTKSHLTSQQNSNSNTPSSAINTTKKEESIRFVPTVSNVLEPLGIVLLRLMFDKSFQKYAISTKVPEITPRGIVNTGNICFMSSILQLLLYCQPFYKALTIISNKTQFALNGDSKTQLFDSIINFYKYFNVKSPEFEEKRKKFGDAITPTDLYQSISSNERFQHLKWGQQEDAEEFFGYLLDALHEEFISSVEQTNGTDLKNLLNSITSDDTRSLVKQTLKKFQENDLNSTNQNTTTTTETNDDDGWTQVSKASKVSAKRTVEVKPSPITQLFGGQFNSILNIPKQKESRSITIDPFLQIQLDISDDSITTLEEAFLKVSEIEEIPMKSSNGEDVVAKKQTFIDKLPEVLIIHLKRFSFNFNNNNNSKTNNGYHTRGRIEKLTKKIEYKHDLIIPQEIISPSNRQSVKNLNYKLTGVVYHIGSSSEGGHYIVDVLSDDGWISIDDTTISELKPNEVLEKDGVQSAYILMYQKA